MVLCSLFVLSVGSLGDRRPAVSHGKILFHLDMNLKKHPEDM